MCILGGVRRLHLVRVMKQKYNTAQKKIICVIKWIKCHLLLFFNQSQWYDEKKYKINERYSKRDVLSHLVKFIQFFLCVHFSHFFISDTEILCHSNVVFKFRTQFIPQMFLISTQFLSLFIYTHKFHEFY